MLLNKQFLLILHSNTSLNFLRTLGASMENEGNTRLSKLDPDEYYYSPEGYVVFTEKYLLKRGYCCKNGCRHCPYNYNIRTGKFDKKPNGNT